MADSNLTFNTTSETVVEREMLVLYLNTGSAETPAWSAVGKRVEDSSVEYDWGDKSKKDIFGVTYTTLQRPTLKQSFDPCELDSADAAQVKLWNLAVRTQDAAMLAAQDCLIVHLYAGTANTAVFAERYSSTAIKVSKLGGSANVGMPIEATFGGKRTTGTAARSAGVVTFTADAAA